MAQKTFFRELRQAAAAVMQYFILPPKNSLLSPFGSPETEVNFFAEKKELFIEFSGFEEIFPAQKKVGAGNPVSPLNGERIPEPVSVEKLADFGTQ